MTIPGLDPTLLKQAARTALAAMATLLLTRVLGLEYGYWAVISAIIIMQSSLGGSIRAGVRRVAGTAVGVAVGMGCLFIGGIQWWTLGLAVFVTLALSALATRAQETFRMAGVSAAIVLLAWPGTGSIVHFGVERFAEIIIGVGVALFFSLLLWPSRAVHRLSEELAEELRSLAKWQRLVVSSFLGHANQEKFNPAILMAHRLRTKADLLDQARQETALLRSKGADLFLALGSLERIFGLIRGLNRIAMVTPSDGYQQRLAEAIEGLGGECAKTMRTLADRIQPGVQGGENTPSRLPVAVEAMEDRLHELREEQATAEFPLMDVANVFAFVQTLKSLAVELEWLALKW